MKKYYIEIVDMNGSEPYNVQSKWYNTKEQALEFFKQIDFTNLTISLMSSEWDEQNDCPVDIKLECNLA